MAIMMTIPAAIGLNNHVSATDSVFIGKEKNKKSRMKYIIFLIVIVCAIRFITSVPGMHELYHITPSDLIVIVYAIRVVTSVPGMHELYHITPSDLLPTFFWIFPQAVISCFIVFVISGPAYVKIIHKLK
jgi:hypothetical protein